MGTENRYSVTANGKNCHQVIDELSGEIISETYGTYSRKTAERIAELLNLHGREE